MFILKFLVKIIPFYTKVSNTMLEVQYSINQDIEFLSKKDCTNSSVMYEDVLNRTCSINIEEAFDVCIEASVFIHKHKWRSYLSLKIKNQIKRYTPNTYV